MEIILALMALAATPFGAAMLDKPTRGRFVKYVKVHAPTKKEVARKYQSLVAGEVAQVAPLEPRSKDHWKADGALQTLWQEAFVFLSLKNREAEFSTVLKIMAAQEKELLPYETRYREASGLVFRAKEIGRQGYHYMTQAEQLEANALRELNKKKRDHEREFTANQKVVRDLVVKYKIHSVEELKYHNDLVRLATGAKLPTFDYVALTAYTVNK